MCKKENDKILDLMAYKEGVDEERQKINWTIGGHPVDPKDFIVGIGSKPDYDKPRSIFPDNLRKILGEPDKSTLDDYRSDRMTEPLTDEEIQILKDSGYTNPTMSPSVKLKCLCAHLDLDVDNNQLKLADMGNGICYICNEKIPDIDRVKYKLTTNEKLTDDDYKILNDFLNMM